MVVFGVSYVSVLNIWRGLLFYVNSCVLRCDNSMLSFKAC